MFTSVSYNVKIVKKKGQSNQPKQIQNRRARHDYELGDSLVAGIVLTGGETKALRMGHGHLRGSYVTVKDSELWLLNSTIVGSRGVAVAENEQTRSRKLLVKRRDIDNLIAAKQQGRTIVPLEILTQGRHIKVRIALGQGRKRYDKRQVIKKRENDRLVSSLVKRSR